MNNYLILFVAFVIGQAIYTAVTVYNIQKNMNVPYWTAFRAYVLKELGGYIVALLGLAGLMFIISDFIDPSFKHADADVSTWAGRVQAYFRTSALCFGVFAQHIVFVAFKKGKKAIEKVEDKINNED
jgi:hypothetical protein